MYCANCGIKIPPDPEQVVRMSSAFRMPVENEKLSFVQNEMNCGFCRNCGTLTACLTSYLPNLAD